MSGNKEWTKPVCANFLPVFGQSFFSTLQSSFMPVNVPNLGADYIVDVGDTFTLMTIGQLNQNYELMVQRDGSVIIPEFGKVIVAGKSLQNAEKSVQDSRVLLFPVLIS